jgi:3-oxoacid CoA-transferase subunit A
MNKVVNTPAEAVADVPDGAVVMIGGFAYSGAPRNLIMALGEQGAKGLTIITNGPGTERFIDSNFLVKNKQVKKLICSITFPNTAAERAKLSGEMEMVLMPQGNLAEAIRAAGCGIGGFYTPTGVGTEIEAGKEKKIINGKEYILELPLKADYSLIRAHKADRFGNLIYRGVMRNFNVAMATAARITIAEVDEIVEPGELDPNIIVTPEIFVDRIVKVSEGESK